VIGKLGRQFLRDDKAKKLFGRLVNLKDLTDEEKPKLSDQDQDVVLRAIDAIEASFSYVTNFRRTNDMSRELVEKGAEKGMKGLTQLEVRSFITEKSRGKYLSIIVFPSC
jgi:hypothetical protein